MNRKRRKELLFEWNLPSGRVINPETFEPVYRFTDGNGTVAMKSESDFNNENEFYDAVWISVREALWNLCR